MLNDTITSQLAALGGLIPAREGAFAPLSSEDIAEIEGLFGHALPADYRAFVSEYGRGAFANLVHCNITASRFVYLGIFYGSGQDVNSPSHVKWALKMLCYRMPPTLLPIVDSAGGEGQICLGLSGEEYGKVYFWDRAEGWEGEADEYLRRGKTYPEHLKFQNVTLLAESFEQFVLSLVAEEE